MSQENKQSKSNMEKTDGPRKGPKFNIYWIYGIIIVALISAQIFNVAPELKAITEKQFRDNILIQGDVQKLDLVKNKEQVYVYVKKDRLEKDFYVKQFKGKLDARKVGNDPIFSFEVVDWKAFEERLDTFCKANNLPEVDMQVIKAPEWFGPLLNTVFTLLIIIVAWVLLMRKMGGPSSGGGPGGIFNIGKSKATLFDKGAKVNITLQM